MSRRDEAKALSSDLWLRDLSARPTWVIFHSSKISCPKVLTAEAVLYLLPAINIDVFKSCSEHLAPGRGVSRLTNASFFPALTREAVWSLSLGVCAGVSRGNSQGFQGIEEMFIWVYGAETPPQPERPHAFCRHPHPAGVGMAGRQRLGRERSLGWVWGAEWWLAETAEGKTHHLPRRCIQPGLGDKGGAKLPLQPRFSTPWLQSDPRLPVTQGSGCSSHDGSARWEP